MPEVEQWFGGAPRVLFVHAHPDDETIATGGSLAALAAAEREPLVVTLTRGERGEAAGSLQRLEGTPELASHREGELAEALSALGVTQHAFLGSAPALTGGAALRRYEDSGMAWAPDGLAIPAVDAGPNALTRRPVVDAIADLFAACVEWEVAAIVSYDAIGGYRHPDHVFAHRLSRAVAHGLEMPFWEIVTDRSPAPDLASPVEDHEVSEWLEAKRSALREYASQLTVDGDQIVHVGGQRQGIDAVERFRRAV